MCSLPGSAAWWRHGLSTFITSHCPQDLGDSSKNPVLVISDDKDAESKEDRKTGKKYKRKRQKVRRKDRREIR